MSTERLRNECIGWGHTVGIEEPELELCPCCLFGLPSIWLPHVLKAHGSPINSGRLPPSWLSCSLPLFWTPAANISFSLGLLPSCHFFSRLCLQNKASNTLQITFKGCLVARAELPRACRPVSPWEEKTSFPCIFPKARSREAKHYIQRRVLKIKDTQMLTH